MSLRPFRGQCRSASDNRSSASSGASRGSWKWSPVRLSPAASPDRSLPSDLVLHPALEIRRWSESRSDRACAQTFDIQQRLLRQPARLDLALKRREIWKSRSSRPNEISFSGRAKIGSPDRADRAFGASKSYARSGGTQPASRWRYAAIVAVGRQEILRR
jgi:hypothetical protein